MRLQIEVTKEQDKHIQSLMEQTGLSTKKDLFNNALTLLSWTIEEVANGNTIASVNEKNQRYRVLQMPIFTHVVQYMKNQFGDVRRKAAAM
jgi:hypothetical protein